MSKIILILFLLISNTYAIDFSILEITSNDAFNYFASLQLWLLIISSPMLLVFSLFRFYRKSQT